MAYCFFILLLVALEVVFQWLERRDDDDFPSGGVGATC